MGCGLVTSFLRVYHHYHVLQSLKDLRVFLGLGWFFFQPLAQQFTLLPSHEEKKVREKLFKPAHHQQNRHYRQQSQSEASKGVVCPGGAELCKAGRKALPATLQRGIRCQCQWLLSNIHCPSQRGPSLPTCT